MLPVLIIYSKEMIRVHFIVILGEFRVLRIIDLGSDIRYNVSKSLRKNLVTFRVHTVVSIFKPLNSLETVYHAFGRMPAINYRNKGYLRVRILYAA